MFGCRRNKVKVSDAKSVMERIKMVSVFCVNGWGYMARKKYIIESCQDIWVEAIQGNRRNRKQQAVISRQLEQSDGHDWQNLDLGTPRWQTVL